MKQTLGRLFLAAFSSLTALSGANAQALPNGTLETWSTRGLALAPADWFTFDDFLLAAQVPVQIGNTTRTTDKHGGTYAAQLENKTVLGNTAPGVLGVGPRATVDQDFPGGISFTGRPAGMQFYYKLTGAAAASELAGAQVVLTKWDGTQSNIIGGGALLLTPTTTYTLATIPVAYVSAAAPDSIHILFTSSTQARPTVGSTLFIDDVVLTGTITAVTDAARNAAVSVYPNPSTSGLFALHTTRDASWTRAAYTVTDATGRVILRQAAAANVIGPRAVDLRSQRAGVYTLRLETPDGPVFHKLVIQ
jgi:hypothetical protein